MGLVVAVSAGVPQAVANRPTAQPPDFVVPNRPLKRGTYLCAAATDCQHDTDKSNHHQPTSGLFLSKVATLLPHPHSC